jgi:hypothetical protein
MKPINRFADKIVERIDSFERTLLPILKTRRLTFGRIYYIMGIQIVLYDRDKRKKFYYQYR